MKAIIAFTLIIVCPFLLSCQDTNHLKGARAFEIINVSLLSLKDTNFRKVLDKVLELDKESKYYSEEVSYGIRFYDTIDRKVIKIEGSDIKLLFLKSTDLIGFFRYNEHDFFLLTRCEDLFTLTDEFKVFKCDDKIEIAEDDRFPIYYFGYDHVKYYFYNHVNYIQKGL